MKPFLKNILVVWFVCFIILTVFSQINAETRWNVVPIRYEADTVWVHINLVPPVDCEMTPSICQYHSALLRVEPCPLFVSCPDSAYEKGLTHNYFNTPVELALEIGVSYIFKGHWTVARSDDTTGDLMCDTPTCEESGVATPTTYRDGVPIMETNWGYIKSLYK